MKNPDTHIFAFTRETLGDWCEARNMPRFRATQILEWVYRHGVIDPKSMSNLAKRERETLASEMTFLSGDILEHQSATDGTRKLLVEWMDQREEADSSDTPLPVLDGNRGTGDPARQTECVMIPAFGGSAPGGPALRAGSGHSSESRANTRHSPESCATTRQSSESCATTRRTACISSQVGCPVGCKFCASGLGGLDANLSSGRIVEQVWMLDQLVKGRFTGGTGLAKPPASQDPTRTAALPRISNVVFMGMGEPLANFAPVVDAVRTIAADWGMGIGARRITISTVGLPKAIDRLAQQLELPVTLALSLHAPNDELRRELIPWAEYTTIADLLRACRGWFEKTGREITLEYILLGGLNDQEQHAQELSQLAKRLRANVNLIRYNEVKGMAYSRPIAADVRRFQEILRERGVNSHIRASRGRDIAAACGQLRHEMSGTK